MVSVPTVIILGYVAGSSYQVVEKRLGQASYVLLAIVAGVILTRVVLTKRRERQEQKQHQ
jgi:membrane protein DedA with SNARE-associated domain